MSRTVGLPAGLTPAFILFAEGFSSLGCELLALRRLIPISGSGLQTNSILIGCWLAMLAWGYHRGGKELGDARAERARVGGCLSASAIVALAALGLDLFLLLSEWPAMPVLLVLGVASLFVSVVALWCGEVVARLPRCGWPGWSMSRILLWSTLGSAGAAVLLPLALMPWLGLQLTVTVLLALLVAAAIVADPPPGSRLVRGTGVVLVLLSGLYAGVTRDRWLARTGYADYVLYEGMPDEVVEDGEDGATARGLAVNKSLSSRHSESGRGHAYIERLEEWLCGEGLTDRVLTVGAAGMTLGLGAPCNLSLTFADIDPAQPRIAARFLGGPRNAPFIGQSAFRVLASPRRWRAIILDAYTTGVLIPPHLLSLEFHQRVRDALQPDGWAVYNFIDVGHEAVETRRMRTLHAVWADCVRLDGRQKGPHNSLVACRSSAYDGDRTIYSLYRSRAAVDLMGIPPGFRPSPEWWAGGR